MMRDKLLLGAEMVGVGFAVVGCAANTPILTPVEATRTALNRDEACLSGQLPREQCATKVEFSVVQPRFAEIRSLYVKASLSARSRQTIDDVFLNIEEMQQNGMTAWYLSDIGNADAAYGNSQSWRRSVPLPSIFGPNFIAHIVIPRETPKNKAQSLGVTIHEALHARVRYTEFKNGQPYSSTDQEEYEAEYLELLTESIARMNNIPSHSDKDILLSFGIDLGRVVYFLDQNNFGPDSRIYWYLSDNRMRYGMVRNNEATQRLLDQNKNASKNTSISNTRRQEIEARIREYELQIAKNNKDIRTTDLKWSGFPTPKSVEDEILRKIKARPEWYIGGFFEQKTSRGGSEEQRGSLFDGDDDKSSGVFIPMPIGNSGKVVFVQQYPLN